MAEEQPSRNGLVPLRGVDPLSPLVRSFRAGCHGTDMAEALSVHFSSDSTAPGSSSEGLPRPRSPTVLLMAQFSPASVWF